MTVAATARAAGLPERYYAPEFVVEVEGDGARPGVQGRRAGAQGRDGPQGARPASTSSSTTTTTRRSTSSGRTPTSSGSAAGSTSSWATPSGMRVDDARRTSPRSRPDFPSDGPPTLTVRALDALVRLKGSKPPEDEVTYTNKARLGDRRRRSPSGTTSGSRSTERGPEHTTSSCQQQHRRRARSSRSAPSRIDFERLHAHRPRTGEDVLHFVSPTDGARPSRSARTCSPGAALRNTDVAPSLIEFKPTMAAGDQVQSVTVRGWDPETQEGDHARPRRRRTRPGVARGRRRRPARRRPSHARRDRRGAQGGRRRPPGRQRRGGAASSPRRCSPSALPVPDRPRQGDRAARPAARATTSRSAASAGASAASTSSRRSPTCSTSRAT